MIRFRVIAVAAALFGAAGSARAQRWGGSPVARGSSSETHQAAVRPASGISPNGTPSKWGGSPIDAHAGSRMRGEIERGATAYIPVAVAAPAPVPVTYLADPGCAPTDSSVTMQVITAKHEDRQLTTIEVYRLQPRFQRFQHP
jgi:hypothetical protein